MGFALSQVMSPANLEAWGWRAAFLLGAAVVPVALAFRNSLVETHVPRATASTPSEPVSIRLVLAGFMMLAGATTVTYVLNFLTTFASNTLKLPAAVAFGATAAYGLSGIICAPLAGWASDRFGRKWVMLPPALLLLVLALPVFLLIVKLRSAAMLLGGTVALSICATTAFPVIMCCLAEGLPKSMRSGAIGLIYALAISVFGGSTQFVVAWLSGLTHSELVPAWYMTGGVTACVLAMLAFPRTAPKPST